MEKGSGVSNNSGEVFPNGGAGNGKAVQALERIKDDVKGILERNRMLIQEIEQNQEAHGAEGSSRNVALAYELHINTTHVMELYSDLSSAFSLSLAKGSPANADATKED